MGIERSGVGIKNRRDAPILGKTEPPLTMSTALPPVPSLDELAAYLVPLEADDADGVERLRLALHAMTSSVDLPVRARVLLDEAAQAVDAAATTGAVQAALDTVSRLVEEAMKGLNVEGAPVAAPKPVAPPVAAPETVGTAAATTGVGIPTDEPFPDDADRDLLGDFITESRESLAAAEAALLALEGNPHDTESINTVFRAFHTIKGTSAFLGLVRASEFAHHAESLLSRVRDREIQFTPRVADLSLKSSDLLKEILDGCETGIKTGRLPIPSAYASLMHAVMAMVELSADEVNALLDEAPADHTAVAAAELPAAPQAPAPVVIAAPEAPEIGRAHV